MKILVSCYACSPYQGSEPGMGWNFVNALSRFHELYVISESKFEKDIDKFYSEYPENQGSIKFFFLRKNRHKKLRKVWPPSYYWFYNAWQKRAYQFALELHREENFDVVHQLNMVGYREPGYLWNLGIPFIWGPIGGFGNTPWNMLPSMGLRGCVYYFFRNIINYYQSHCLIRVQKAMEKSSCIVAATQEQKKYIKKLYNRDCVVISEVGLSNLTIQTPRFRSDNEKLRICWSGQHIPCKSLNLLLDAVAIIGNDNMELHIIGDGVETKHWKGKAKRLNINNIIWHGKVERTEALNIMQECHLFCITSLSDLTSSVLLEALSCGLPVIALDHCGFSDVITDDCGKKIAIRNKEQVIKDFGTAILEMLNNEPLRRKLGSGALERAKIYNWEDKAKVITEIYESVSF